MKKALVAFFSASGVTERAAEKLARAAGADLYEIRPAVPYTKADLNWLDKRSRSSVEMNDKAFRPAAVTGDIDVSPYDTVFVGFPIWWYVAPTVINTFLEAYDFSGKTVVVFATSGGSGFGNTVDELVPSAPGAKLVEGCLLNGTVTEAKLEKLIACAD